MHMSIKWTQWCISAYNQQQQQQLLWQQQLCLNHLRHTAQLGRQQQQLDKCIYKVWLTFPTIQPMILQPFEKKFNDIYNIYIYIYIYIQIHQQPYHHHQPNLTNQVIKHRNITSDTGLLASASTSARHGELKEWATRLRRAKGELGASRTRSSRPFWHFSHQNFIFKLPNHLLNLKIVPVISKNIEVHKTIHPTPYNNILKIRFF